VTSDQTTTYYYTTTCGVVVVVGLFVNHTFGHLTLKIDLAKVIFPLAIGGGQESSMNVAQNGVFAGSNSM